MLDSTTGVGFIVIFEDLHLVVTGTADHVLRHRPIDAQYFVLVTSQVVQWHLGAGTDAHTQYQPGRIAWVIYHVTRTRVPAGYMCVRVTLDVHVHVRACDARRTCV